MLSRVMRRSSSVILSLTTAFLRAAQGFEVLPTFWAAGFAGIALAFNPAVPFFQASGDWFHMTALACTVVFAISLTALRTRPAFSMASTLPTIRGANPFREPASPWATLAVVSRENRI